LAERVGQEMLRGLSPPRHTRELNLNKRIRVPEGFRTLNPRIHSLHYTILVSVVVIIGS
jgi:hypothetical protein